MGMDNDQGKGETIWVILPKVGFAQTLCISFVTYVLNFPFFLLNTIPIDENSKQASEMGKGVRMVGWLCEWLLTCEAPDFPQGKGTYFTRM